MVDVQVGSRYPDPTGEIGKQQSQVAHVVLHGEQQRHLVDDPLQRHRGQATQVFRVRDVQQVPALTDLTAAVVGNVDTDRRHADGGVDARRCDHRLLRRGQSVAVDHHRSAVGGGHRLGQNHHERRPRLGTAVRDTGQTRGVAEVRQADLSTDHRRGVRDQERELDGEVADRVVLGPHDLVHRVQFVRGVVRTAHGEAGGAEHVVPLVPLDLRQRVAQLVDGATGLGQAGGA